MNLIELRHIEKISKLLYLHNISYYIDFGLTRNTFFFNINKYQLEILLRKSKYISEKFSKYVITRIGFVKVEFKRIDSLMNYLNIEFSNLKKQ